LLKRGISFWRGKGDDKSQIYLIGNPVVWLTGTLAVIGALGLFFIVTALRKRQIITNHPPGTDWSLY